MTVTEAAASLGLSPRTVRQAIENGAMRARRVGPMWTVTPAEVERYRAERLGRRGRPRKASGSIRGS